jgi:transcriptional regulator with XRE-family HTH domain
LKLTQEKFAVHLGVSFPTINRWENGHTTPSPLALKQIEMLLNQLSESADTQYLSGFGEKGKGKEKTFNLFPKPNSELKMQKASSIEPTPRYENAARKYEENIFFEEFRSQNSGVRINEWRV